MAELVLVVVDVMRTGTSPNGPPHLLQGGGLMPHHGLGNSCSPPMGHPPTVHGLGRSEGTQGCGLIVIFDCSNASSLFSMSSSLRKTSASPSLPSTSMMSCSISTTFFRILLHTSARGDHRATLSMKSATCDTLNSPRSFNVERCSSMSSILCVSVIDAIDPTRLQTPTWFPTTDLRPRRSPAGPDVISSGTSAGQPTANASRYLGETNPVS